jgi:hypothetical protein
VLTALLRLLRDAAVAARDDRQRLELARQVDLVIAEMDSACCPTTPRPSTTWRAGSASRWAARWTRVPRPGRRDPLGVAASVSSSGRRAPEGRR